MILPLPCGRRVMLLLLPLASDRFFAGFTMCRRLWYASHSAISATPSLACVPLGSSLALFC
jgi:hypothetical protein